jgi:hypothetical protein
VLELPFNLNDVRDSEVSMEKNYITITSGFKSKSSLKPQAPIDPYADLKTPVSKYSHVTKTTLPDSNVDISKEKGRIRRKLYYGVVIFTLCSAKFFIGFGEAATTSIFPSL